MAYLGRSKERDMYYGAKPELFRLAERMRQNPTIAEHLLWQYLKKLRYEGFIFRRQHPLDLFIVDFYCHRIKLVIEVDGDIHLIEENIKYDENRTGELERFGLKVIRFKNDEIMNALEQIIRKSKLSSLNYHPPPSWGRGTGGGEAKVIWSGTGGGEAIA